MNVKQVRGEYVRVRKSADVKVAVEKVLASGITPQALVDAFGAAILDENEDMETSRDFRNEILNFFHSLKPNEKKGR
jgi:hypothetical protein